MPNPAILELNANEHSDFTTDHKDSVTGGSHGDLGPGHIDMPGFKLLGGGPLGMSPAFRPPNHSDFSMDHKDAVFGGGHGDLNPGHVDMAGFVPAMHTKPPPPPPGSPSASPQAEHADFKTDHKDSVTGGSHGDLGPGHIDMIHDYRLRPPNP